MPGRTKASLASSDSDCVYAPTAPTPKQVHFPARERRVRSRRSLGSKLARQSTLTQIDWGIQPTFVESDAGDDETSSVESASRSRRKRRKTEGDTSRSLKGLHTQTITQMLHHRLPLADIDADELDRAINGTLLHNERNAIRRLKTETCEPLEQETKIARSVEPIEEPEGLMGPPRTPHRQRLEIPSSQSPATPLSAVGTPTRSSISPLKNESRVKATWNNYFVSPDIPPSGQRPLMLKVEDTFDSENCETQSSALVGSLEMPSSPLRAVRFASQTQTHEIGLYEESHSQFTTASPELHCGEIEDSEAESSSESDDDYKPESCYDAPGDETQFEADALVLSAEVKSWEQRSGGSAASPILSQSNEDEVALAPYVSQFGDTQRLSTQDFNCMAPRSDRSDIIIPIHPEHVVKIVDRRKNHEFRTWQFPQQVTRIWIYETSPSMSVRYMATISSAKLPGHINNDDGEGNAEFDASEDGKYAYEILELYELANPVSLADAKEKGWLRGAPQSFVYVRPAILDQLMANLKPALLTQGGERPRQASSDSQDAAAQLQSTLMQFTQFPSSLAGHDGGPSSTPPSGQAATPSLRTTPIRPSQATTVGPTQTTATQQSDQPEANGNEEDPGKAEAEQRTYDEEESGSVVPESPILRVPSSMPRTDRRLATSTQLEDMPIPFSLNSSQFLTRSQMLPHSLVDYSAPLPPSMQIGYSQDEE